MLKQITSIDTQINLIINDQNIKSKTLLNDAKNLIISKFQDHSKTEFNQIHTYRSTEKNIDNILNYDKQLQQESNTNQLKDINGNVTHELDDNIIIQNELNETSKSSSKSSQIDEQSKKNSTAVKPRRLTVSNEQSERQNVQDKLDIIMNKNNSLIDKISDICHKKESYQPLEVVTDSKRISKITNLNSEPTRISIVKPKLNLNLANFNNLLKTRIESKMQDKLLNSLKQEAEEQLGICIVIDHNGKITYTNQEFSKALFQIDEEIIGTNLTSYLDHTTKSTFEESIQQLITHQNDKKYIQNIPFYIQDQMNKLFHQRADLKLIKNIQFSDKPYINIYVHFENLEIWQTIDPLSNPYLVWTIMILSIIVFMLFQIPYDISFGGEDGVNNMIDLVSFIIFTIDIILNFFTAYEEDGMMVNDLEKISMTYLKTWFMLDFCATFPFDLFLNLNINTQFIKGFKLIKLVKLLRMLRIDPSNMINFNELSKNEQGKELIQLQRRNKGFLSLLRNNFQIVAASHYQTIIFQYLKQNFIEGPGNFDWLNSQQNQKPTEQQNVDIYFFMMQEHVKTSLGLGVLVTFDKFEIVVSIMWMFLGLSLFGQGIGNISSYLSFANQADIEQQNSVSQFTDLCTFNNIDTRTQTLIMSDIEKHQEKYGDIEFLNKGSILSNSVFFQLEASLQKSFIKSFKMLEKLNISTIRILKSNCHTGNRTLIIRNETPISSIFLVTKGTIKIYDDQRDIINEQSKDEIFGMDQFKKQCSEKQSVDIEKYQEQSFNKINRRDSVANKMKNISSVNGEVSKVLNEMKIADSPMLMQNEFVKIIFNQSAMGTEDVEQIEVSFEILDDIMLKEIDSFLIFFSWCHHDNQPIENSDREIFKTNTQQLQGSTKFVMIVLNTGQIQEVNSKCESWLEENKLILVGRNIVDFINFEDNESVIKNFMDQLKLQQYELKSEFNSSKIEIMNQFKHMIIREGTSNQFNLKKSMLQSFIIEFDLKEITKD